MGVIVTDEMSQSTNTGMMDGISLSSVTGAVTDVQTYKNLLYLMLAFPLGMIYYIILTLGFALGLGLAVVVIGLGILFGTVVGLRYIASFERRLANALLGTDIRAPDDLRRSDGIVDTVKAYLQASSTWRGLAFVVLKFWIDIVAFVLLLASVGVAIELIFAPVFPNGTLNVTVMNWEVAQSIETTAEQALAVPAGVVIGVIGLNVSNAFARTNASIASSLLGAEGDGGHESERA